MSVLFILAFAMLTRLVLSKILISNPKYIAKVDEENKSALDIVRQLLVESNEWRQVSVTNNVKVEKRFLSAGPFVSKKDADRGAKHACVKATGVINCSPESAFDLFVDNSRVLEYNDHCTYVKDLSFIGEKHVTPNQKSWTKITWAFGPKYGPMIKARDFCSIVHFIKYPNGTSIILNRPGYDERCPATKDYVRATILLAANVIRPYGNGQTHITQIAHVNPGGGADNPSMAWIINQLCAVGPPNFMKKLETAAKKSPMVVENKSSILGAILPFWQDQAVQVERMKDSFVAKVKGLVYSIDSRQEIARRRLQNVFRIR